MADFNFGDGLRKVFLAAASLLDSNRAFALRPPSGAIRRRR